MKNDMTSEHTKRPEGLRTWIEVSRERLAHNAGLFRALLKPTTKLMAVVKSNAYGHGLVDFSTAAKGLVDWFGVDSITEGLRLRKEGIAVPILVLGYTLPERVAEAVAAGLDLTVSNLDTLRVWNDLKMESGQKIAIHIKVDTGLHRQGFLPDEQETTLAFLKQHADRFDVRGLYTHFAKGKNPDDRAYTEEQIAQFKTWIEACTWNSLAPVVHAAASASAIIYPEAHFDMVRVGAGLYGFPPSPEAEALMSAKNLQPKPILTWKTVISELKKLPKGSGIGYDLSETLSRDSLVAVCPIGYWHGFPRSLSSKGEVLVKGKRAKVLGRVAMDMISIDVTDVPGIAVLDQVTLIGQDGNEEVDLKEYARLCDTSPYEIVTRLNPLMKKFYR